MNPIAKEVLGNGFAIAESVMPIEACNRHVESFETLLLERYSQGQNIGNSSSQVIRDYFIELESAAEFFDNDLVDEVMRDLIDDDYALTSTAARNKQIRPEFDSQDATGGIGWHTDGRYIRGRRIMPSLTYYCVYLLQDSTTENGGTEYVPHSTDWSERVDRNADFAFETFTASAGSVLFFDSGLVHRSGTAGNDPRWGVWSLFSPWYVKPYNNYPSYYSAEEQRDLSPRRQQLLHFDSQPPNLGEGFNLPTLKRIREQMK